MTQLSEHMILVLAAAKPVLAWGLGLGNRFGRGGSSGGGGGLPVPPDGFVFLIDENGAYYVDENGAYYIEAA